MVLYMSDEIHGSFFDTEEEQKEFDKIVKSKDFILEIIERNKGKINDFYNGDRLRAIKRALVYDELSLFSDDGKELKKFFKRFKLDIDWASVCCIQSYIVSRIEEYADDILKLWQ